MLENLKKYRIVLASNSPRRRELLAGLGLDFEVRTLSDIDESYPKSLPSLEVAEYIAMKKANAYLPSMAVDELLVTADTVVVVDNSVLGKPTDAVEAKQMLKMLSGRTHQVVTGVSLTTQSESRHFAVRTDVTFKPLSDAEIDYYVDTFRPFDKAGAYGIQEWIGYIGCTGLQGSYYNVMGLPVQRIYTELTKF